MPAAAPPAAPPPAALPNPGSAVPPSTGEIHVVPPTSLNEGNPTIAPPKPGSARARLSSDLKKLGGIKEPDPKPPVAPDPKKVTPPVTPPAEPPGDPAEDPNAEPPAEPAAPVKPAEPATTTTDGKKVSPWKLVDQYKDRATKAESRILELEKQVLPAPKRKEQEERVSAMEKRMQEMTDDLRYYNAEKYDPDVLKADAEYQGAWKRALSELSEITIADPQSGQPRPVNAQDLIALSNMPLGEAREVANRVFGDFADDVMAHRKAVRELFQAKSDKLAELKKNGSTRDQQRMEQAQKMHGEIASQIKTTWEGEIAAVLADEKIGKFFKAREGDDEWNQRLEQGFKFVDESWSANTADPRLTPEQRANMVKRHVAVRNRAAAFRPLRLENERLAAKVADLEKKLSEFQETTPTVGSAVTPGTAQVPVKAKDQMFSALRKLAK